MGFAKADDNHDGCLTEREVNELCKEAILAQVDSCKLPQSSAGYIQIKGMYEGFLRSPSFSTACKAVWEMLDENHDGKVSKAEFEDAFAHAVMQLLHSVPQPKFKA